MKASKYSGDYENCKRAHDLAIKEDLIARMGWDAVKRAFWVEVKGRPKSFAIFGTGATYSLPNGYR